jgi:acetyl-CoA synthetase (ADP-forming)
MAGSDRVYEGAFHQTGIIRAEDIEDLFDMAKAFSTQPLPTGDRVLVITNSGGPGVMMVDALEELKLSLPETPAEMKERLDFLPRICSRSNPIDLTAQGGSEEYKKVLQIAQASQSFDVLIALWVPPAYIKSEAVSKAIVEAGRGASKPILACFMSGDLVREGVGILESEGVPNFPTPKRTAKAVWALVRRGKYLSQQRDVSP